MQRTFFCQVCFLQLAEIDVISLSLFRPSGTEDVVRVYAEAETQVSRQKPSNGTLSLSLSLRYWQMSWQCRLPEKSLIWRAVPAHRPPSNRDTFIGESGDRGAARASHFDRVSRRNVIGLVRLHARDVAGPFVDINFFALPAKLLASARAPCVEFSHSLPQ